MRRRTRSRLVLVPNQDRPWQLHPVLAPDISPPQPFPTTLTRLTFFSAGLVATLLAMLTWL